MRIFFMILTTAALSVYAGSGTLKEDPVPSFQQSESLNIRLGVRDKNGAAESFTAVFTVKSESGDILFTADVNLKRDEWGFVYFPGDFSVDAKDGEYKWSCESEGKVIAFGSFIYTQKQKTISIPEKK